MQDLALLAQYMSYYIIVFGFMMVTIIVLRKLINKLKLGKNKKINAQSRKNNDISVATKITTLEFDERGNIKNGKNK